MSSCTLQLESFQQQSQNFKIEGVLLELQNVASRSNAMLRVSVTIEGLSPYMPHRFNETAEVAVSGGASPVSNLDRGTPKEIAESFLYKDREGNPVIMQPAIFGSIMQAGKFHKLGKSKITTQQTSLVPGYMTVAGTYFLIDHHQPWRVDSRPVRIPSTGGRIIQHRPIFDDWKATFEIEIFDGGFSEKLVRQLVDDAGLRIGIGDLRPEKKGPYGRFKVNHWTREEMARAA
jgi:hypothetical protein